MLDVTAPRRIYNPVQQDAATFLETAEESGGARTLLEVEVAPGGGNARHRHLTYAEHFEVVEGTLTVEVGSEVHALAAGDRATAPVDTPHCFRNETSETVVFRVELDPGHRGMEKALQVGYGLAADGLCRPDGTPRNPLHLGLLADWSDIRMDGRYRLVAPVVGLLAAVARRRGVDRELAARYVAV